MRKKRVNMRCFPNNQKVFVTKKRGINTKRKEKKLFWNKYFWYGLKYKNKKQQIKNVKLITRIKLTVRMKGNKIVRYKERKKDIGILYWK